MLLRETLRKYRNEKNKTKNAIASWMKYVYARKLG